MTFLYRRSFCPLSVHSQSWNHCWGLTELWRVSEVVPFPQWCSQVVPFPRWWSQVIPFPRWCSQVIPFPRWWSQVIPFPRWWSQVIPFPGWCSQVLPFPRWWSQVVPFPRWWSQEAWSHTETVNLLLDHRAKTQTLIWGLDSQSHNPLPAPPITFQQTLHGLLGNLHAVGGGVFVLIW